MPNKVYCKRNKHSSVTFFTPSTSFSSFYREVSPPVVSPPSSILSSVLLFRLLLYVISSLHSLFYSLHTLMPNERRPYCHCHFILLTQQRDHTHTLAQCNVCLKHFRSHHYCTKKKPVYITFTIIPKPNPHSFPVYLSLFLFSLPTTTGSYLYHLQTNTNQPPTNDYYTQSFSTSFSNCSSNKNPPVPTHQYQ
jgi:hypothetical protein